MAKKAYIGVDGVARRIRKGYIGVADTAQTVTDAYVGVNGVARKIRKAYIGVGGVARPCFGSNILTYYGPIASMSAARHNGTAASNENYAAFTGSNTTTVDAYSRELTKTNPSAYYAACTWNAGAHLGEYMLFVGGLTSSTQLANAIAYDETLTKTTLTNLSVARYSLAGGTVNGYALFGGGANRGGTRYSTVDAYSTTLTRTTVEGLSAARSHFAAGGMNGYAIFAGGENNSGMAVTVDAYDQTLTRSIPTPLSQGRMYLGVTKTGNDQVLVAGGNLNGNGTAPVSTVDAYDTSLTRSIPAVLSKAVSTYNAGGIDEYHAVPLMNADNGAVGVDLYDASLTKTTVYTNVYSSGRLPIYLATAGSYLLAGGSGVYVDAFTLV